MKEIPVIKNLFVGLAKKQAHKRFFCYLGKYRVSRVNALTIDEWMGLMSGVRHLSKVSCNAHFLMTTGAMPPVDPEDAY